MQSEFNKIISQSIESRRSELAEAITARLCESKPELTARFGESGRVKCLKDVAEQLSYLAESIGVSRPDLFADYAAWAKTTSAGFGMSEEEFTGNLKTLRDCLAQNLPPDQSAVVRRHVDAGLRQIKRSPAALSSFINESEPLGELCRFYLDALLGGERHAASGAIHDAVRAGTDLKDIYLFVFQRAQHEIGRLWQINELSVAQEHYCTAATQMIMSQLYEHFFATEKNGRTMIATCVEGDNHELGARMVADFFEMDGWDTHYLGANVPTVDILNALAERRADLIVISATMTFHVRAVGELIKDIRASEAVKNVKIMVGGYPFNIAPDLWRDVGADAFSADANNAIKIADNLVGAK